MPLERNIKYNDYRLPSEDQVVLELTYQLEFQLGENKPSEERMGADIHLSKAIAVVLKEYLDREGQAEVDLLLQKIVNGEWE